ncbi:MAG TPA: hypothetical protein VEJ18_17670, partial [Planctomycetota bacterium]|nr:hypothetical protein [Planctomycetota bacterium]
MGLLLTALSMLQEARQEGSGYVFTAPAGWTRHDEPVGTIYLPAGAAPADAALVLYPVTPDVTDTPREVHEKMVRTLTAAGTQGEPQKGATGLFLWTRATVTPAGGAPTRLAIYTALSGKDAGVVLFGATEALFRKHLPEVERLVDGLRFKGAPEPVGVHGLVIPFPPGWT